MSVVVIATLVARRGSEEQVQEVLVELMKCSRKEAGNLQYETQVDNDDPRVFVVYEQYEDVAAYAAHQRSSHYLMLVRGRLGALLADRTVRTMTPLVDRAARFRPATD